MNPAAEHDTHSERIQPQHWYSTNLVGVPAPVLTSLEFNAHPISLAIAGVRPAHKGLFSLLDGTHSLAEAGEVFDHYLTIVFGLQKPSSQTLAVLCEQEGRRWRSSWRKLLQGWGMDANGPAGAVLKGWVESRFGMTPLFHKDTLGRFPSPTWVTYLEEKSASRYHNNSIHQQLDLVYEYTQWALRRFALPEPTSPYAPEPKRVTCCHASERRSAGRQVPVADDPHHLRLWRGSTRAEEQVVSGKLRERRCVIRLNSIASFSRSREAASCFGDWVFETRVPLTKIVVAPGMLPGQVLQGEQEVLALGGDYDVEASYV